MVDIFVKMLWKYAFSQLEIKKQPVLYMIILNDII